MRTIDVSTEVFAKIWSLREVGEETEDAILQRVLEGIKIPKSEFKNEPSVSGGFFDKRFNAHFLEGFEIFRNYLGTDFRARATGGHWLLLNDDSKHRSLNALSQAVGVKIENAWANWFFINSNGERRSVSELRDPLRIIRRKRRRSRTDTSGSDLRDSSVRDLEKIEVNTSGDGTWREDVRIALQSLGGQASLHAIYKKAETIRRDTGRSIPVSLEAVVRRTLEEHSSDSEVFKGRYDLFCMPEGRGAGFWALR